MASPACTWRCAGVPGETVLAGHTGAVGSRSSSDRGSAARRRRQRWAAASCANARICRGTAHVHRHRWSNCGANRCRHLSSSSSAVLSSLSAALSVSPTVTAEAAAAAARQWRSCRSSHRFSRSSFLPPVPERRGATVGTDVRRPFAVRATNEAAAETADVSFVTPEEARALVTQQGYIVVDVRDNTQFQRSRVRGSVHVPLFVENTDMDPATIIKRQMHSTMTGSLYGTAFTKPNDQFLSTMEAKFSKNSKLLLVCQEGLRSAKAADELVDAGYRQVSCLTSGLQAVKPGMFEKEGERELADAGKAGIAAIQGKISVVLGTVLITLYLVLKLFPDQAEEIFNRFAP